jgi:hypothetical protein
MSAERPSPFTIPEPQLKFCEGPAVEPVGPLSATLGMLIHNLTAFAEFYESKTRAIETASPALSRWHWGDREANADAYRRKFLALRGIDRVRGYVLARYGEELTVASARKVLGDLIRTQLTMPAAESLMLDAAMDRLSPDGGAEPGHPESSGPPTPSQPERPDLPPPAVLPTGKVSGVVSLNVLAAHLTMLGDPDFRRRYESWPEVPFLKLRCAALFPGQPFPAAIDLLIAWFQENGLTPEQARHLPLAEAKRRLSRPHTTPVGVTATASAPGQLVQPPTSQRPPSDDPPPAVPAAVRSWLQARYLSDPCPDTVLLDPARPPEPAVFITHDQFAEYLVDKGDPLIPIVEACRSAGLIDEMRLDLSVVVIADDEQPPRIASWQARCIQRLRLAVGLEHRLFAIRRGVLDTPPESPARAVPPAVVLALPAVPPPTTPSPMKGEGGPPVEPADGQRRDPRKPSKDRQADIIGVIVERNTPLTRPEIVDALKLKTEGKLGANLAWMVDEKILVNLPQRGYWPADRPAPE